MTLSSLIEIIQTRGTYQEDFDASLKTSMTVLSPAISMDIFNVDQPSALKALYGIFSNKDIVSAVILTEDKKFFTGALKKEHSQLHDLQQNDELVKYVNEYHDDGSHEFRVLPLASGERVYIYPLYNDVGYNTKIFLHGYLVIKASTHALSNRILFMFLRLLGGLFVSFALATVVTRLILQIQVIKPIASLMEASIALAKGKFTKITNIKEDNKDEIYQLTTSFNTMAYKIEEHLNLLRGMSLATQEIVKSESPEEIYFTSEKHLKELLDAREVYLCLNISKDFNLNFDSFKIIPEGSKFTLNKIFFHHMETSPETFFLSAEENPGNDKHAVGSPLLTTQGKLVGIIIVLIDFNHPKREEEILQILRNLSISVTTAIVNYGRVLQEKDKANIERDLELAKVLQNSILSTPKQESDFYRIATFYKPAGKCGGDWFATYELDESRLFILFGDVSGHGTPAALLTAATKGYADMLVQSYSYKQVTSEHIITDTLSHLNRCLFQNGKQLYFMSLSAFIVNFREHKIYASSAGHNPTIMLKKNEKNQILSSLIHLKSGDLLGFSQESFYESTVLSFFPGDKLIFYTDGLVEGENEHKKKYGLRRLKATIEKFGHLSPATLLDQTYSTAFAFFGGVIPADDITLLAIEFKENK